MKPRHKLESLRIRLQRAEYRDWKVVLQARSSICPRQKSKIKRPCGQFVGPTVAENRSKQDSDYVWAAKALGMEQVGRNRGRLPLVVHL